MSVKLRKKKLANGEYSLYLDIYTGGRRKYEFLSLRLTKDKESNKTTLLLAEKIRLERQIELQDNDYGHIPASKKKVDYVRFLEKLVDNKYPKDRTWRCTLNYIKSFSGGSIRFQAITEAWLEDFQKYLLTHISANAANVYYSKIIASFNQAIRDRIIQSNPASRIPQIKTEEVERSFLTLDELKMLAETPCKHLRIADAFLFSCFTGLRLVDVKNLTWSNIKDDTLQFKQKKTGGFEYLPLSSTAQKILNNHRIKGTTKIHYLGDTKIFSLPKGESYMNRKLREWCEEAGISKYVSYHSSRHTFAILNLSYGSDLYTVSKLLGHRDLKSTQIYARVVDEMKQKAISRLPEIEVK